MWSLTKAAAAAAALSVVPPPLEPEGGTRGRNPRKVRLSAWMQSTRLVLQVDTRVPVQLQHHSAYRLASPTEAIDARVHMHEDQ